MDEVMRLTEFRDALQGIHTDLRVGYALIEDTIELKVLAGQIRLLELLAIALTREPLEYK